MGLAMLLKMEQNIAGMDWIKIHRVGNVVKNKNSAKKLPRVGIEPGTSCGLL